jgi:hypothetical protein
LKDDVYISHAFIASKEFYDVMTLRVHSHENYAMHSGGGDIETPHFQPDNIKRLRTIKPIRLRL